MIRRPPRSTRTDTRFPYTTLFRAGVGDDPGTIASGPVTADASTFEDAWQVIERYDLAQRIPSAIRRRLEKGRLGQVPETPKPGDDFFANVRTHIMGNNRTALAAAEIGRASWRERVCQYV